MRELFRGVGWRNKTELSRVVGGRNKRELSRGFGGRNFEGFVPSEKCSMRVYVADGLAFRR